MDFVTDLYAGYRELVHEQIVNFIELWKSTDNMTHAVLVIIIAAVISSGIRAGMRP